MAERVRTFVNKSGANNMRADNSGMAADGAAMHEPAHQPTMQPAAAGQFAAEQPATNNQIHEYVPSSEIPGDTTTSAQNQQVISGQVISPYFAQIRQNEQKMEMIRTMPVTGTDGRTVTGVNAANELTYGKADGRMASGGQAALESLRNPMYSRVRDWGDLAGALANTAGAFIGGAIDKNWNERKKRVELLGQLQNRNQQLSVLAQKENAAMVGAEKIDQGQQKIDNKQSLDAIRTKEKDDQFNQRVAEHEFKKLNVEQQGYLKQIGQMGRYKRGESKEFDDKLRDANMVIPDFDSHPPRVEMRNGKSEQYDYSTGTWKPAEGLDASEYDQPVKMNVNGVNISVKGRDLLNFQAANQRQDKALEAANVRQQNQIAAASQAQIVTLSNSNEKEVRAQARRYATEKRQAEIATAVRLRATAKENGDDPNTIKIPALYSEAELQQIELEGVRMRQEALNQK